MQFTGQVEPWDEANKRLVAEVHPPDWPQPKPADRYNLVVIGGGTAGLVSAMGAAGLGAKVALVERALLGGDCLVMGCVPSKALIAAAHAAHGARHAARFGISVGEVHVDFARVMEQLRKSRAAVAPHDSARRLSEAGVDVFFGDAQFTGPDRVRVGDIELCFRRAVIATGGRAWVPDIDGLSACGYLTNETVFSLTELPLRLAVIGGGPIGAELAQSFARLGSTVTLLEMGDRLMPRDDADAAAIVTRSLTRDGVRVVTSAQVRSAAKTENGKRVVFQTDAEHSIEADAILVAAGRRANVEALGLEHAGVALDDKGRLILDDHLRTGNRNVFAAGDVGSAYQFTHAADAMARIVLQNALFWGRKRASRLIIPWATYTDPEVAHVGLGIDELDARSDLSQITVRLDDIDRAIVEQDTEGFARVHHDAKGRIHAVTIVGRGAGNLIGEASLAMSAGLRLSHLAGAIHPYPTRAEALKRLGDSYNRTRLTPRVHAFFVKLFGWLR
jgi:pyruvate/2-oxoglutarate dehydrogenase complex dihydrolipoamide dehydrogenase (E3) component